MHYTSYQQRKFIRWLLLSLLSLLLAACSTTAAPPLNTAETDFAYVAKADIATDASQAEVEAMFGGKAVVFRPEAGFAVLGFSEAEAALTTLATDANQNAFSSPEVSAAGFDAWAGGFDAWAGGFDAWAGGVGSPTTFGQNLPLWNQINLAAAQGLSRNLGANVTVAVLDTGIDTDHPALSGRLTAARTWKDYVDNDANPNEVAGGTAYGHGTAVAGVVLQVAPRARIMPLRVLGPDGSGSVADVVSAVDWAVSQGADVINLSLGSETAVDSLGAVLDYAAAQGIYIVASSGNTGNQKVTYPASLMNDGSALDKQSVSVGSVNTLDRRSRFSTYGPKLEMVAPGENVHTLYPDGRRAVATGTSFAAPMVAGSLALSLGESNFIRRYTPSQEVVGTALKTDSMKNEGLGKGRLDLHAYLSRVLK